MYQTHSSISIHDKDFTRLFIVNINMVPKLVTFEDKVIVMYILRRKIGMIRSKVTTPKPVQISNI